MVHVEARRRADNEKHYESKHFSGRTWSDVEEQIEEWGGINMFHADGTRLVKLDGEWFSL